MAHQGLARALPLVLGLGLSALTSPALAAPPDAEQDTAEGSSGELEVQTPGWADSLDPEALASYLRADDESVLVIGAGPKTPQLEAVVDTMKTSLRARSLQVSGASWTGAETDGDQAIVAAAAKSKFAPDAAMIVRLFDGELVVSVYDPQGEVVAGFILAPRQPLEARVVRMEAGGLQDEAADTITDLIDERPDPELEAEVREARVAAGLQFHKVVALNPFTGQIGYQETDYIVRAGNDGDKMKYAAALRYMGHGQLADDYQRRNRSKFALVFCGAFLAVGLPVGGLLVMAGGDDAKTTTGGGLALAVGITGSAMVISGIALPKIVNKEQMRRHIANYNSGRSGRQTNSTSNLRVSPTLGATGGGLVLSGRF